MEFGWGEKLAIIMLAISVGAPKVRKSFRLVKVIGGIVLLPLILVFSYMSLEHSGFFNVDHIEIVIEGVPDNPLYLQPLVRRLDSSLARIQGQSLWRLNLSELSLQISGESWIREVAISRRFPSKIRVAVEPRSVELLYLSRAGKLLPIVADGTFLEAIEPRLAPSVPLLIGENFADKVALRKKSVETLKQVPAEGSFSRRTISEVRFDAKEGFWMTLMRAGISVKMGEDLIGIKSARVTQVIDYMNAHNFQPRVIDANLSKKVLVRLRKDP